MPGHGPARHPCDGRKRDAHAAPPHGALIFCSSPAMSSNR
jgi:hypothetical protein